MNTPEVPLLLEAFDYTGYPVALKESIANEFDEAATDRVAEFYCQLHDH